MSENERPPILQTSTPAIFTGFLSCCCVFSLILLWCRWRVEPTHSYGYQILSLIFARVLLAYTAHSSALSQPLFSLFKAPGLMPAQTHTRILQPWTRLLRGPRPTNSLQTTKELGIFNRSQAEVFAVPPRLRLGRSPGLASIVSRAPYNPTPCCNSPGLVPTWPTGK